MDDATPDAAIRTFLAKAGLADAPWERRRLGTDRDMVERILEVIARGEKSMTFSLPWVAAHEGRPPPAPGLHLVLVDTEDAPRMLLRLTEVRSRTFGTVDAQDLAREGRPMRNPEAWRDLHRQVWNARLAHLGRSVDDAMPVWAEYFERVDPA